MLEFTDKNYRLTSFQFDFKTNNSTELAITSFYDSILLKKLYHYEFCEKVYNFLTLYISYWSPDLFKNGSIASSPRTVDQGVPQGVILSPLLFLLFVKDLAVAYNFDTTLFADDTNLHFSPHNINTLQSQVTKKLTKLTRKWEEINWQ